MLKKSHAAREFSTKEATKRMLYSQGRTRLVALISSTHLAEVLDREEFILEASASKLISLTVWRNRNSQNNVKKQTKFDKSTACLCPTCRICLHT